MGFLNTESIFTDSTNPFTQSLFKVSNHDFGLKESKIIPTLMLGKRAEYFFKHQITNSKQYHILKENIQIQKEKRTLGEIDFILEDSKTKKLIHVEISYKFYLYDSDNEGVEINKWIGPNRNDDLVKKVTKLKSHQFPLLFSEIGKAAIPGINFNLLEQEVLFKAQLFIPRQLKNKNFTSINSKSIRGFYYSYHHFLKNNHSDNLYYIPSKQDWLAKPSSNNNWKSFKEVSLEIKKSIENQKSLLIWVLKNKSIRESLFITWW